MEKTVHTETGEAPPAPGAPQILQQKQITVQEAVQVLFNTIGNMQTQIQGAFNHMDQRLTKLEQAYVNNTSNTDKTEGIRETVLPEEQGEDSSKVEGLANQ